METTLAFYQPRKVCSSFILTVLSLLDSNFLGYVFSGRAFWNLPLNIRNNKTKEGFPVIIPDVDNDNVLDFVWIKDVNRTQLVSGLNGTVLSSDFNSISQNCSEIKNLRMHNEFMLKLDCKEDDNCEH